MYDIKFDIRIGCTGVKLLWLFGAIGHEGLTAVGDAVNVASRVRARTKTLTPGFWFLKTL
ncbi:MAG: hypothetical protein CM1200mP20_06700 [Pseudomonadota bacterium]|nr:MAG: hypothetical protein CM1200mP20_06700 [Pseudomonadota bacterium]